VARRGPRRALRAVPVRWALPLILVAAAGSCVGPGLEPPVHESPAVSRPTRGPSDLATSPGGGPAVPASNNPTGSAGVAGSVAMAPGAAPVQMTPTTDAGEMDGGSSSDSLAEDGEDADGGL